MRILKKKRKAMPRRKLLITSAIILTILFLTAGAQSAEIEGVVFEDSVQAGNERLTVRGTGLYRYLKFIKAYVGALYIAEGEPTENVMGDVGKRLELEYFHAIEGEDFGSATNKVVGKNVDGQTLEKLRPRIDEQNALYRSVQPGDRYALTYLPGRGTQLTLNGEPLGRPIPGAEFAFAIFAMWLGENPMNTSFKQQLMGAQ